MKIRQLLHGFIDDLILNKFDMADILRVTNDSQQIVAGSLFLAEQGISSHGLDHLTEKQLADAVVIVYQPDYNVERFSEFKDKLIALPNLNRYVGEIARRFYRPSFAESIIGVTGTNGKTSIANFIAQLSGYGVVGTMGYGELGQLKTLSHTTPNALLLQSILSELSDDVKGVAMEVSSHAMALHRVDAVDFDTAVFSNLTQDHLDFHADMEAYFQAKAKLFEKETIKVSIINIDDDYGRRLALALQKNGKTIVVYGRSAEVKNFPSYVHIDNVQLSAQGLKIHLQVNIVDGKTPLQTHSTLVSPVWGLFNAYNLLAAMLSLYVNARDWSMLLSQAALVHGVTGRIDPIDLGDNRTAIIDYAHTPDALASTLQSLRDHTQGSIVTIFGCGGDRDKSKRPLMAEAVNDYSDAGIITDDNPRTEKSADIIADILTGKIEMSRFQVVASRRKAIRLGLSQLQSGDVLLIAGKGHETYQIIGTEKTKFSDYQEVREWLASEGVCNR